MRRNIGTSRSSAPRSGKQIRNRIQPAPPCGEGLFAVRTAEEAAAAINEIHGNYVRHSARAREIASEYLDAPKVLSRFLSELGIQ